MITNQDLDNKWKSMTAAIKEQYAQITDDELNLVDGSVPRLTALLQQRTGQSRQQVEAFMSGVCEQQGSTFAQFCDSMSDYCERASQSVRSGVNRIAERGKAGLQQSSEAIASRPVLTVGTALGIGLITGIAIGLSLAENRNSQPTWRDRWNR